MSEIIVYKSYLEYLRILHRIQILKLIGHIYRLKLYKEVYGEHCPNISDTERFCALRDKKDIPVELLEKYKKEYRDAEIESYYRVTYPAVKKQLMLDIFYLYPDRAKKLYFSLPYEAEVHTITNIEQYEKIKKICKIFTSYNVYNKYPSYEISRQQVGAFDYEYYNGLFKKKMIEYERKLKIMYMAKKLNWDIAYLLNDFL